VSSASSMKSIEDGPAAMPDATTTVPEMDDGVCSRIVNRRPVPARHPRIPQRVASCPH